MGNESIKSNGHRKRKGGNEEETTDVNDEYEINTGIKK